ncbi:MAG: hypothetical protein AAGK14_12135 [Verrucomicrobiota bacterium]
MKPALQRTLMTAALAAALGATACTPPASETEAERNAAEADRMLPVGGNATLEDVILASETRHGIRDWEGKDSLQADMTVDFGGQRIVDGTFTFQAHGPAARFDGADGSTVVFDGETAWATPPEAAVPMARFHVLTWPWFLIAPFKMDGDGVELSDLRTHSIRGREYIGILQEFTAETGDTPDDWYRLFIDPQSKELHAMSYIVTYNRDLEEANQKPSIVLYRGYADVDGAQVPNEMEFWFWDKEKGQLKGDAPKGTGSAHNLKFVQPEEGFYAQPEGAQEIPLPQTDQT